ncbi:MAG: hypothetical protein NVSMB25_07800 [Thermoleophilaceae bacterium]
MRLKHQIIAVGAAGSLLVGAPAALAQSPAQQGYSLPGGVIQSSLGNPPAHKTAPANVSSPTTPPVVSPRPVAATQTPARQLPFTGLDIGLVLAVGGLLLALGLGIRRLTAPVKVV